MRRFIFLFLAALLLAGCEPNPTPSPEPTDTSTPTLTNTPAPPDSPVFVDYRDRPLSETSIELFCATETRTLQTDTAGQVELSRLEGCDLQMARYEFLPKTAESYTVYHTSYDPISATSPSIDVKTIVLSHPLIIFDVTVSLAWDASGEYIAQLETAFNNAANYFYDATEGQATFGTVEIYTNGKRWSGADYRVLAANDMRPTAFVGGIVNSRQTYETDRAEIQYEPGAIYLGRQWDKTGPTDGSSWAAEDGYKTLVHEWGHHALLLFDSYINVDGSKSDCLNMGHSTSEGVMSWHYGKRELWFNHAFECERTLQFFLHEEPVWETLPKWGEQMGHDDATFNPLGSSAPSETTKSPLLDELSPNQSVLAGNFITPYIDFDDEGNAGRYFAHIYTRDLSQKNIIHQGTLRGTFNNVNGLMALGEIELLGADVSDIVYINVDVYFANGITGHYASQDAIVVGDILADPEASPAVRIANWHPTLRGNYIAFDSNIVESEWRMTNAQPFEILSIEYCEPDMGCIMLSEYEVDASGSRVTVNAGFPSGQFGGYGILHISTDQGNITRWIRDGGGVGPAHVTGDAPAHDGELAVNVFNWHNDLKHEVGCSRIVIMPSANGAQTGHPTNIVGLPLDISIVSDQSKPCDEQLALTYLYDRVFAEPFGGNVRVGLMFRPNINGDQGEWQPLPPINDHDNSFESVTPIIYTAVLNVQNDGKDGYSGTLLITDN